MDSYFLHPSSTTEPRKSEKCSASLSGDENRHEAENIWDFESDELHEQEKKDQTTTMISNNLHSSANRIDSTSSNSYDYPDNNPELKQIHINHQDTVEANQSAQLDHVIARNESDCHENLEEELNDVIDDELGDLNDKSSNPIELPKPGQFILFWDPLTKSRQVAEIKHMVGTVQKRNPGWRNVLVKGELKPRSLNLDLQCDKCI